MLMSIWLCERKKNELVSKKNHYVSVLKKYMFEKVDEWELSLSEIDALFTVEETNDGEQDDTSSPNLPRIFSAITDSATPKNPKKQRSFDNIDKMDIDGEADEGMEYNHIIIITFIVGDNDGEEDEDDICDDEEEAEDDNDSDFEETPKTKGKKKNDKKKKGKEEDEDGEDDDEEEYEDEPSMMCQHCPHCKKIKLEDKLKKKAMEEANCVRQKVFSLGGVNVNFLKKTLLNVMNSNNKMKK